MENWIQKWFGSSWERKASALLLGLATAFYLLYYLHLQADFPNHAPWMDWAKYTDEGWYGNAAIEHFVKGHWYVPGDFNPGVALPVWPLLEAVVFKLFGVSLEAARALTVAVFGATLAAAWLLIRRYYFAPTASLAVLLLAASPFCYAFERMAILEPLLILLMLLALLSITYANQKARWPVIALGLLLPMMVLTKTTAIFLLPAVFFLLLMQLRGRLWVFVRQAGCSCALAAALWGSYYGFFVKPYYLKDYQYLFSANTYTGITLTTFWSVLGETLKRGMWMDRVLYPAFGVLVLVAIGATARSRLRWLRNHVLVVTLIGWTAGYFAFLAYHNNMQPRYFLVIAIPMMMAVAIGAEICCKWLKERELVDKLAGGRWPRSASWGIAIGYAAVLALAFGSDARLTLHFVRTPEYTFLDAARQVSEIVGREKGRNPLIMSISGNDITLMTGLESICDDFGTMELEDRIAAYKPGWYVSWNLIEDDKQEALDKFYNVQRVAEIPAMDDPDRDLLILYKLDPIGAAPPKPVHHRRRPHVLDVSGSEIGWERLGGSRLGMDFSGLNAAQANRSILDYSRDTGKDSPADDSDGKNAAVAPAAADDKSTTK